MSVLLTPPQENRWKIFQWFLSFIDPHVENAGLQEAQKLLTSYRNIRKRIYGDEQTAQSGFFSVKVETLKDVNKNQNSNVEDKFYFRSDAISKSKFSDFISLKDMSTRMKNSVNLYSRRMNLIHR